VGFQFVRLGEKGEAVAMSNLQPQGGGAGPAGGAMNVPQPQNAGAPQGQGSSQQNLNQIVRFPVLFVFAEDTFYFYFKEALRRSYLAYSHSLDIFTLFDCSRTNI
jgi:hypothetical protein